MKNLSSASIELQVSFCHEARVYSTLEETGLITHCAVCGGTCTTHIAEYSARTVEDREEEIRTLVDRLLNNL